MLKTFLSITIFFRNFILNKKKRTLTPLVSMTRSKLHLNKHKELFAAHSKHTSTYRPAISRIFHNKPTSHPL